MVVLKVPTRDAHSIFETLNTRGVRLSNGDLVKSHLIARADDTVAAVKRWNDITTALKDDKGAHEDDLESFLLHYYGSQYGKTVRRELFTDYRPRIADSDPLSVLDDLHASAVHYNALAHPALRDAYWATLGGGTRQVIELINGLGLKQLRYLLLAVLRDFCVGQSASQRQKKQAEAIVRLAAWSVRALVGLKTGGGEAEKTYIDAAALIREGKISAVDQLKKHFIDREMLMIDDELFMENFRGFVFDSRTSHTLSRAILYALEYFKIAKKSALKPRDTLTVEHVLPLSPGSGWAGFDADARAFFTHRLGNLLLVDGPSGANNSLGAKEWADKRALIKSWGQQSPLTTEALARSTWTREVINARHEALAKLAAQAFAV